MRIFLSEQKLTDKASVFFFGKTSTESALVSAAGCTAVLGSCSLTGSVLDFYNINHIDEKTSIRM